MGEHNSLKVKWFIVYIGEVISTIVPTFGKPVVPLEYGNTKTSSTSLGRLSSELKSTSVNEKVIFYVNFLRLG